MITLDPYQIVSHDWLLQHDRGILGDEPGVGKSHPAIQAALDMDVDGPNLIVCPAYLIPNWEEYLRSFGEKDICIVEGNKAQKGEAIRKYRRWTLCSYAMMSLPTYASPLVQVKRPVIIMDEVHRIKGRNSKATDTAYLMPDRALKVWMLTGTPILANPGDIYPLLHICDRKVFSSYWKFVKKWCHVEENPWTTKVGGIKEGLEAEFEETIKPYMLRRTLKETRPEIPEVIEELVIVEMEPKWQKAHRDAKREYIMHHPDKGDFDLESGGALVNALRNLTATSGAKTAAVVGILEDLPPRERVVVFTWYRETAHLIGDAVRHAGHTCAVVTGEMKPSERKEQVHNFDAGDIQVIVATLGALREGENLQSSHIVIMAEEDWVDGNNLQAVRRCQRRGQEQTVLKYVIVCKHTVDGAVHRIASKRGKMTLGAVIGEVYSEGL